MAKFENGEDIDRKNRQIMAIKFLPVPVGSLWLAVTQTSAKFVDFMYMEL